MTDSSSDYPFRQFFSVFGDRSKRTMTGFTLTLHSFFSSMFLRFIHRFAFCISFCGGGDIMIIIFCIMILLTSKIKFFKFPNFISIFSSLTFFLIFNSISLCNVIYIYIYIYIYERFFVENPKTHLFRGMPISKTLE